MKVRIYALIGEANAGKSMTISCLTGRTSGRPASRRILTQTGGYISVWSKTSAWQEDNKSPSDAVAEIRAFAARQHSASPAIASGRLNALMTLRFDAFQNPGIKGALLQPPAEEYLSEFVVQDWEISSLVLFTSDQDKKRQHFERFGAPTLYHQNATDKSFEAMAGLVRRHFGWA